MTAELRLDLVRVAPDATVPLPAQRVPHIPVTQPIADRLHWQKRYTAGVIAVDLVAIPASTGRYVVCGNATDESIAVAGTAVVAVTVAVLRLAHACEQSVLGQGSLEFARLLRRFMGAAVVVALAGLA